MMNDEHSLPEIGEPLGPKTRLKEEAVGQELLKAAARAFLAVSIKALREVRVLPTPFAHPYIQIGRDYFGADVAGTPELAAFEQALKTRYPNRFLEPQPGSDLWESTDAYTFSLLEAVVARCGRDGREVEADSDVATLCINELIQILDAPDYEMVCCREVSHLTTADGDVLQLGDVCIPSDMILTLVSPWATGVYALTVVVQFLGAVSSGQRGGVVSRPNSVWGPEVTGVSVIFIPPGIMCGDPR